MRKSRFRTKHSHVGGADSNIAIVPPAAKTTMDNTPPDRSEVLRSMLTQEELDVVGDLRAKRYAGDGRRKKREDQVRNDTLREKGAQSRKRNEQPLSAAAEERRRGRKMSMSSANERFNDLVSVDDRGAIIPPAAKTAKEDLQNEVHKSEQDEQQFLAENSAKNVLRNMPTREEILSRRAKRSKQNLSPVSAEEAVKERSEPSGLDPRSPAAKK